ncbi:cytokine receptor family member b2 isoform X1 [Periophthalmus magnuspinnatus]|uniref:cytokine receptor family member b2 isoform X1 n=1 Tax=Periophthalmus magnuspinnatus TaxID=409849 RepID=UPI00145C0864|nr:cytokine receptor family member b2 isoform X1 [Periophthalmus magnuspinnatus]
MYILLLLSWIPQAALVKSVPPAPVGVVLKSSNMNHMLQWDRGVGTPAEVTYSVSFYTDSDPRSRKVAGCEQLVEPLVCDLTKDFSDPDQTYHMWVTAHHRTELSSTRLSNFHPIRDTELQPPILRLAHCESSLCIDMDAPVPDLYSIYNSFGYELKVQMDSQRPMLKSLWSLERKVEPGVKAGSHYCVSIRFSDQIVPRNSDFSPPKCVYIHSPIYIEHPLAALAGLLVLLLLVVLTVIYSGYICLRPRGLPSVLTSTRHLEERLMVFFHDPISFLHIITQLVPSYGQTECCTSESDNSEDEGDSRDGQVDATDEPYASKGSLCSALSQSPSAPHGKERMERTEDERRERAKEERIEEGRMNGAEEVNLLTLKFSRDTDLELDSAIVVSEIDFPVCDVTEEQHEPKEDFGEECCKSGYMSR